MTPEEEQRIARLVVDMLVTTEQYKGLSEAQIKMARKRAARDKERKDARAKRKAESKEREDKRKQDEREKWALRKRIDEARPGFVQRQPQPFEEVPRENPQPVRVDDKPRPEARKEVSKEIPILFEHVADDASDSNVADLSEAAFNSRPRKVKMFRLKAGANITINESSGIVTIEADLSDYTPSAEFETLSVTFCSGGSPVTRDFYVLPL